MPAQAPVGTAGAGGAAKALAAAKVETPKIRDEKVFIEFPFGFGLGEEFLGSAEPDTPSAVFNGLVMLSNISSSSNVTLT